MREQCVTLFHVDAFTDKLFCGNSAGVVLDADGLSERTMQKLAAELRHSETAFVFKPDAPDHQVHIRFFTPTVEVPLCGHATIAAHYARALHLDIGPQQLTQKTGAGFQRISIEGLGQEKLISMDQGAPSFEEPLDEAETEAIARALGIKLVDLIPDVPIQIVSTGHSKVMVPLKTDVQLDALSPDLEALTKLSRRIGCNGYFPFQITGENETYGRMFAPAIGIPEDPVTGNANGPLGAYLVRYSLLACDGATLAFDGNQGRAVGRPGKVRVKVEVVNGSPVNVTVTGAARVLFRTRLTLD